MDLTAEPKILSIAPSFNCSLKCDGCYLTTDVTKAMREATKNDYYWERAMQLGRQNGYEEFAMTLNPYPGAFDHALELAAKAKNLGYRVNITWSPAVDFHRMSEMIGLVDILSISIDHERRWAEYCERVSQDNLPDLGSSWLLLLDSGVHVNFNLLWTPQLFDYARENGNIKGHGIPRKHERITVQHLIMKPLSLYGDLEKFQQDYLWVMDNVIPIAGDGETHIGDPAYGNLLGINECPGKRMLDIDPMGNVRRCPENPNYYDGKDLLKLEKLMKRGLPECMDTCNCLLG